MKMNLYLNAFWFITVSCSVCFEVFKMSAKSSAFEVFKI